MREEVAKGNIWFGKNGNGVPRVKKFLNHGSAGLTPETLWLADEVGTNDQAKKALIRLQLDDEVFDTPKPESLVRRILQIGSNRGDLVLDSFLGSGTTAAVAQKMGRPWIAVEMGQHATTQCAPRLRAVISGEQSGVSEVEQWKGGGGFRYCTLGISLFDEHGGISDEVRFTDLAQHIFFTETGQPAPTRVKPTTSPFLGTSNGVAYYLLFNGILGDRRPDGGNILTSRVLADLPPHDGPRVIFGEGCRLGAARLKSESVTFKQIPYQIKT
jgi:adenine-specific DNA-methyltransferase